MIRLYAGYLDRFTFNGTRNINETMTYYRTERGTVPIPERLSDFSGYQRPEPPSGAARCLYGIH